MKLWSWIALGATMAVVGCDGGGAPMAAPVDVKGTVKYSDGAPVTDLEFSLAPMTSSQTGGTSKLSSEGKYETKAVGGKYYVVISAPDNDEKKLANIPKQYQAPDPSTVVEVPSAGGTVDVTIPRQ